MILQMCRLYCILPKNEGWHVFRLYFSLCHWITLVLEMQLLLLCIFKCTESWTITCCNWCRVERSIIESYFWDGFRYDTILRFLHEYHNIHISHRTLRRRLCTYGLRRHMQPCSLLRVWNTIRAELQGPGIYYTYTIEVNLIRFLVTFRLRNID